tara:strand:+ start:12118 stop:13932 length:1815 start_codon:yes stop_codon:yes gene_type:complete
MARLMTRPSVVIQEPESGFDVFLKEVAKYYSPEYQLAKKQDERADARLELSRQQFEEQIESNRINNARSQEALKQSKRNSEIREQELELNRFRTDYNQAKDYIDESLKSYSSSGDMSTMNVDSILLGASENEKVRNRLKPILLNVVESAKTKESMANSFMENWNFKNPDNPMGIDDARTFTQDPKSYSTFLYNTYLKEKPEISSSDSRKLTYLADGLSRKEKELLGLKEELLVAEEGTDSYRMKSDRVIELEESIRNFEGMVNNIIGLDSPLASSVENPFGEGVGGVDDAQGGLAPLSNQAYIAELRRRGIGGVPTTIDDGSYDLAFGSDMETDTLIADSAIETAMKNATGENVEKVFSDGKEVPEMWLEPADEDLQGNLMSGVSQVGASTVPPKNQGTYVQELFNMLPGNYTDPTELRKVDAMSDKELSNVFPDNYIDPTELRKVNQPTVTESVGDLRPATPVPSAQADIEGDVKIDSLELEDFSNLPQAPSPTINSLKSLSIADDKGEQLNVDNPAKFQSQLKSMYNKIFRKGARSGLSKDEYTRLNRELIRLISTGSGIQPATGNRMSRIVPREIEMFLKSKKLTPESAIKILNENIRWSR